MDKENFDHLLNRYKRGETSIPENEEIEQWFIEIEPDHSEWKDLSPARKDIWINNLRNDIHKSIKSIETAHPVRRRLTFWKTVAAVAATLAIIVSVAINWHIITNAVHPQQFNALSSADHQKKKILLPDGSSVWINASSTLKFPESFDENIREVFLVGEAYFDIRHDNKKPFIVRTGALSTTVLGTAFNVNAATGKDQIIITVTRGKVSVSDQDHVLAYITPNQQLVYHKTKGNKQIIAVNAQKTTVWLNDIYFDDTTFADAANQIEERFHVKIDFTNERIKNCRFSGIALGSKGLDEILKIICAINQASYTKNAVGQIMISGNGCN